jgi:hypothetical protein
VLLRCCSGTLLQVEESKSWLSIYDMPGLLLAVGDQLQQQLAQAWATLATQLDVEYNGQPLLGACQVQRGVPANQATSSSPCREPALRTRRNLPYGRAGRACGHQHDGQQAHVTGDQLA